LQVRGLQADQTWRSCRQKMIMSRFSHENQYCDA
jgi:hypothetical protein